MTKALKKYTDRVRQLSCCLCGAMPVELHHPRIGQGGAQKGDDWNVVPLCTDCHRGDLGVHGDRTMLRITKMEEIDMIADTTRRLNS